MNRKVRYALGLAVMGSLCLGLTGCGSSAPTHLKSYFSSVSSIVSNLSSSGQDTTSSSSSSSSSSETEENSSAIQLDTPADFTVGEDGSYSFSAVENASQYLIYFCETTATEDGDDYLYSSSSISDTGADSYSGLLSDEIQAAYGAYLVKVFALPDLTDTTYSMSSAAAVEYTLTGAQSDPEIDYFWNAIDSELEVVLTNVEDYAYQAYPDSVDVIFTDVDGASADVTVSIAEVSADNYTAVSDQLEKGVTYSVTAVSTSGSEYVTNKETDAVTVAQALTPGDVNQLSDGYTWSDGWASFPRLTENFDLSGGLAGVLLGEGGNSADMVCTATDAGSGVSYAYTCEADYGVFNVVGTLELYSDGTLLYTEEGAGPVSAGTCEGVWTDNGDGTATLSFAPVEFS